MASRRLTRDTTLTCPCGYTTRLTTPGLAARSLRMHSCGSGRRQRYRIGTCASCSRNRYIVGRQLCETCYQSDYKRGELRDRWPRKTYSRDELMAEWEALSIDHTVEQAAPRLGTTWVALDRAIHRARKAGDPRARRPAWGRRAVA